jgi:ABC-type glycerol-3-phosphate transport system permease component
MSADPLADLRLRDYTPRSQVRAEAVTGQAPALVLFVLAQRFFVRSIASSGLK